MALQVPQSLSQDIRDKSRNVRELMTLLKSKSQEMQRKKIEMMMILKGEITDLRHMSDSLSHMDDPDMTEELSEQKQLLQVLDRDLEESSQEISKLRLMVKDAETNLAACSEELKQMENNKQYPRARYAVNLFRDISKIIWHMGSPPNEVKGFIRGKSNVKTFSFDEQKQSRYFITNSLWEMLEEEAW